MAEAGSFADRVKQQADIVRVVGEYVRLKKGGQNFVGLCPFHSEKTPSFAVHPVKQIYHCFGCGAGGDVFKFVMEMDKCDFVEAVRTVADKCGIAVPRRKEQPGERREQQQRTALVEMHREAAAFFARQLTGTPEGRAARGYLADRGLDDAATTQFGIGYAPSAGDALVRLLKAKYADKLIEVSGLAGQDPGGRLYDRFRRRIMFPIANESGKVIAFGGRALGDDLPKYLNSPETPIYTKSSVLYHLDRAKEAIRKSDTVVLVEGYMDTIAVARAGIANVVASCGTSLTETQVKLLSRFTRRIVVNYDPDTAGQAATERSLAILLEQNCDVRVLELPGGQDPDTFLRNQGAEAYRKLLIGAPPYLDYLIGRARRLGLATAEEKLRAVNFLLPFVQRIPNGLLRSEWGSRISQQLLVDEPVLREALRRAAAERRSEVKTNPALVGRAGKPAERRLIQLLLEADEFRARLAGEIREAGLHQGLETESIFAVLLEACAAGDRPDMEVIAQSLEAKDRRLLFEVAFEGATDAAWAEAESCLDVLRLRRAEEELRAVQRQIEAQPAAAGADDDQMGRLLARKLELRRRLSELRELTERMTDRVANPPAP
jgi:DNA primase